MKVVQTKPATTSAAAKTNTPFFNKDRDQDFFSPGSKTNESFFKTKNTNYAVQAQLTVGKADDHYEREADAVADKVVQRLSEPTGIQKKSIAPVSSITPLIQNKCASCGQEEKLQKKDKEEDADLSKGKLQKKPIFESNEEPPLPPPDKNKNDGNSLKGIAQKKSIFESNETNRDKNITQRKADSINGMSDGSSQKKSYSDSKISLSASKNGQWAKPAVNENKELLQKKDKELGKENIKDKVQKKPIFESNVSPPDDDKNIQRKCAECEKEEKLQKKNDSGNKSTVSPNIQGSLHSSKGSGSPLPQNTRQQMESSFGNDFSNVRLHNDSSAEQMSKDLNAQAFTHGNDIYFNSGKYDTNSTAGKHLLAHELTHTVQQNHGGMKDPQQPDVSNKIQLAPTSPAGGGSKSGGGLISGGKIDGPDAILENFPLKKYSFNSKTINAPAALINGKNRPILKVGERKTHQDTAWKNMVKDYVRESLIERCAEEGLTNKIIIKRKNKAILPMGKPSDLAEKDELINPHWNVKGEDATNEIEHKVDALIAGNEVADDPTNLMLLDKSTNRSIGSGHVRSMLKNSVDNILETDPNKNTLKNQTYGSLQSKRHVKTNSGVNTDKVNPTSVWEKEDFNKSKLKNNSNPLSKKYLEIISGTVPKGSFILKTKNNSLGYVVKFSEDNKFIKLSPDNPKKPTAITATIKQLFNQGKGKASGVFQDIPQKTVNLVQSKTDPEEWVLNLPTYNDSLNIKYLSPLVLDENGADFNPYYGIEAKGKVKSDIPILRDVDISFKASESDFTISAEIDTDYLNDKFPKPFSVDYSSFVISASTLEGLSVGGEIGFGIEKIGKGTLSAGIGKDGFSLEGNFNFDSKLFKRASIRFSYLKKQWEIGGDLELKEKALKGIKSGSLSVSYGNNIFQAQGTAVPEIKGFKQIELGIIAGPDGFEIDGSIEVEKLPGIKSGKGSVKIINKDGEYSFQATGKILPDIPGIDSEVDFTVSDGLFNVNVNINYKRNRLTGTLNLGITNEGVGADGKPDNKISDNITFYGGGTLGLEITENLKATAGVNILRDGEIEVSGKIELPKALELFPSPLPKKEEDLLPIPALHIPLFAIPLGVANIGLEATIAPHITAEAEIGPGQLTNVFAEVKYNPSKPDDMTITGGADFEMKAYAMIKVGVDFDLGLSVGVASISGGVGLNAGIILEAKQPLLHTELNWSPKSGFDLQGQAQAILTPKLFFSGDAHIKAHVVFLGDYTLLEKELVRKEFDPGLEFGMSLPFHYHQGQPFKLSFSDIVFTYPKFDEQTLTKLKDKIITPLKEEFLND